MAKDYPKSKVFGRPWPQEHPTHRQKLSPTRFKDFWWEYGFPADPKGELRSAYGRWAPIGSTEPPKLVAIPSCFAFIIVVCMSRTHKANLTGAHDYASAAEHDLVCAKGGKPYRYERGLARIFEFCATKELKNASRDYACVALLEESFACPRDGKNNVISQN
jgi:hypothetical protein